MSLITKLKNHKTDTYHRFKEMIRTPMFVWGHEGLSTQGKNPAYFSHPFIIRPDGVGYSRPVCNHTDFAKNVVSEILGMNGYELNTIHRMNLNMTYAQDGNQRTPIHVDHEFPHQNLLIYFDSHNEGEGGQVIVEDEEYYPKEDDAIVFGGLPHSVILPHKGFRTALVTTFTAGYSRSDAANIPTTVMDESIKV